MGSWADHPGRAEDVMSTRHVDGTAGPDARKDRTRSRSLPPMARVGFEPGRRPASMATENHSSSRIREVRSVRATLLRTAWLVVLLPSFAPAGAKDEAPDLWALKPVVRP